jgi:fucose 4-O-acetylase-like acetyltransferase
MAENRNIALDIAKGIGILLVIVGHTAGMKHICQELIYSFHMPLFFIIAGYLYHRQDIKTLFVKSAKRLLLPWIVTLVLLIIICMLVGDKTEAFGFMQGILFPDGTRDDNMIWAGIHSSGAIWFLPALFWCRIIYAMIEQRLGSKTIYVTIPLTLVTVLLGRLVLNLLFSIQMGCSALVFYEIGHRAKEHRVLEKKVPLLGVLLFIPLWIFYSRYVTFRMFWYQYEWTYPIDVMVALAATYSLVVGSTYIARLGWLSRGLEWLGKNSLYILCAHTLMLIVLGYAQEWLPTNGWLVMLINMCLSVLLAVVYVKVKERVICQH